MPDSIMVTIERISPGMTLETGRILHSIGAGQDQHAISNLPRQIAVHGLTNTKLIDLMAYLGMLKNGTNTATVESAIEALI